jgi:DNA ligase (NAD+)
MLRALLDMSDISDRFLKIADKEILLEDIDNEELAQFCMYANNQYRAGNPIIDDADYDFVFLPELAKRIPDHPFLQSIEVESDNTDFGEKIKLPQIMLSTDKAFSIEEVKKWVERIVKALPETNIATQDVLIKATPKLDGFAAFDDGTTLYTRGDGKKGSDISRVFTRGLQVYNNHKRGLGAGEIVVTKSYFDTVLSSHFEHSRNFQASIIREKELDEFGKNAISNGAAVFVPFSTLPHLSHSIEELFTHFDAIIAQMLTCVDFDVDGVIFEVINPEIKKIMGSNRKFHRWMIAFKENKEKAQVEVEDVIPQVGRTGKITPVAVLKPTKLSGAILSHASCYHYNFIKENQLGTGSIVELIRSGLVIPKITKVLQHTTATIPTHCPSCKNVLQWQSDFLICDNHQHCSSQRIETYKYFFATLANNDGFGEATITKLFECGITQLSDIYNLTLENLMEFGFGEKTSENLLHNLEKSRTTQIEDYRFLAAFGVERLGLGNSENLLKKYNIQEIFNITAENIVAIDGFAEKTALSIVKGLQNIYKEFETIYNLGFNLETTATTEYSNNYFANKKLVFTGVMQHSREYMQKEAKNLGAIIQKAVSGKTDFLIIGEKVGQSKLEKAQKAGVTIMNEAEYLSLKNLPNSV